MKSLISLGWKSEQVQLSVWQTIYSQLTERIGLSRHGLYNENPMLKFSDINSTNRVEINQIIVERWFSTDMVIRGKIVDMTQLDGIVVYKDARIVGLVTYRISDEECEITSLDSFCEGIGIGTELMNKITAVAKNSHCKRIKLITTNDNINAIRFYQKRGFDMVHIYRNALDISRKIKPSIPLIGENGIPLKHEIEFELILNR